VTAQELLLLGGAAAEPLLAVLTELTGLPGVHTQLAATAANLEDRYGRPGTRTAGRRLAHLRLRTGTGPLRTAGPRPVLVRLTPAAPGPGTPGPDPAGPDPDGLGRYGVPVRHAIDEDGSLPGITTLLLRPDGYIAWADDSEEDLDQAVATLLDAEGRKRNASL
jgi:hypothetical protein